MKSNISIFKINDDYIIAETEEQAVTHHLHTVGKDWYTEGDELDIEKIPHNRIGHFEREQGPGYDKMTFGEWLADFEYTEPTIICWNE